MVQKNDKYSSFLCTLVYNVVMNLKYENIYADKMHLQIINTKSASQVEELYLNAIYNKIESARLEGYAVYLEKENFGGFFSAKVQVLTVEFKKSKLKHLCASFFIQANGASISFRLYKSVNKAYFKGLAEKPQAQRIEFIKNRLGSFEERDEFTSFDAMMDMLFNEGVKEFSRS